MSGATTEAFVAQWCYGFDALRDHVQQYPPAWAEPITGIPAGEITDLARLYAQTKPAAIDFGNGIEHAAAASSAARSIAILIAITGNLDRPGGNIVPVGSTMPTPKNVHLRERYTQEWIDKLWGRSFPAPSSPFARGPLRHTTGLSTAS